jgi:hypothetical protein
MVEENDENAQLVAHLRFISGQVNMLLDLCVAFISCNSDPERLAQRFETTVKSTLAHTDLKLIAQEFLDGELEIVNQMRLNVMSALPRKEKQHKEIPMLLTAPADADKLAPSRPNFSRSLEALTSEWMDRASELGRNKLLSLATAPPDAD